MLEGPLLKMVPQAPWPFELNGIPQLQRSYKRFAGIIETGWGRHKVKAQGPAYTLRIVEFIGHASSPSVRGLWLRFLGVRRRET